MSNFRGWEILIVLVLLLLLFGAKRLPDAARGLGRSLRIFKAETKGLRDDDKDAAAGAGEPASTRELEAPTSQRETVTPQPAEHEVRER